VTKKRVLTITAADCMRGSGNGGQNRNKSDTACRVAHPPSGAVGYAQEHRTQLENKRAFRRMAESPLMKAWIEFETRPELFRIEVRQNDEWVIVT
jgi:protein subunit release factor B